MASGIALAICTPLPRALKAAAGRQQLPPFTRACGAEAPPGYCATVHQIEVHASSHEVCAAWTFC